MALKVTTEVVNESDGEVVLKRGNEGSFVIVSKLPGRGDRFTIRTDPNATYKLYKLVGTSTSASTSSGSSFVIDSDICLENERIVIKKDHAGELRLDMIKRGMSVTEVVNETDRCFHVKNGTEDLGVLKARGEYLIQRDPKGGSKAQQYSLVEGEKPPILISTEDLVNNQRLTVSGDKVPAITSKIPQGLYLTEVFNKSKTDFKVMYSEASAGSGALVTAMEMVTLLGGENQSFTIEYDPGTKESREYWVEPTAEPLEKTYIPSEYFVQGKRIDIIMDSISPARAKLESAEPRPVPAPTPKKNLLSRIAEGIAYFS